MIEELLLLLLLPPLLLLERGSGEHDLGARTHSCMPVGGLYSVTALRANDQERATVYTKHRLKLHSQTTLTNDGGLKNLDTRRDGGRIGKIVLHVGGSAVAPEGVLRHVHPLGPATACKMTGTRVERTWNPPSRDLERN